MRRIFIKWKRFHKLLTLMPHKLKKGNTDAKTILLWLDKFPNIMNYFIKIHCALKNFRVLQWMFEAVTPARSRIRITILRLNCHPSKPLLFRDQFGAHKYFWCRPKNCDLCLHSWKDVIYNCLDEGNKIGTLFPIQGRDHIQNYFDIWRFPASSPLRNYIEMSHTLPL